MKHTGKKFILILITIFMVPLLWLQWKSEAYAAAPAFADKEVEIEGTGESYQLEILNKSANCKYKWSSSKTSVAKVSAHGFIMTKNKGITTIKCKITYPSKKTKTITCTVTVSIPAQEIKINNANGENNEQKLLVGGHFDFNTDMVPENSSYMTYWSVTGGDKNCIRLDDNKKGIVTGLKEGTVVLTVAAVKKATASEAEDSFVNDAVFINVVKPSAAVKSADITGSNEIKVVFDNPIDKTTVISSNNYLSGNIALTSVTSNTQEPGALSAALSADLKTLTITTANALNGMYDIKLSGGIKTTGGIAIDEYDTQLAYNDITSPKIRDTVLDDSGMVATIYFNEAMDFTGFDVSGAAQVSSDSYGTSANALTLSVLNNADNYIISADKKSMSINLSRISYTDYGKIFSITISGITDLAGNAPEDSVLTTYLYTDASRKPQARLISVFRTSYYTITATFSRDIKNVGYAYIANGSSMIGEVDVADPKKVNYTLSASDAALTGTQTVYIGYWDSYNVISTDTYSRQYYSFTIPFTVDKISPVLVSYDYDPDTCILTMIYNEDVSPALSSGVLYCTLTTITNDIRAGNTITYRKLASSNGREIKLLIGGITIIGSYNITISDGFAADKYMNYSVSRSLVVNNYGNAASALPAPYLITQSATNLSQIYIKFANMIDPYMAADINNYSISGVTIIAAQLLVNNIDHAEVLLTVEEGSITSTIDRAVVISGIKGYNGLYGEMSSYTKTVSLKENVRPYYVSPPVFDSGAKNIIRLNFNEAIAGSMTVRVTQVYENSSAEYSNTVTITDKSVIITLTDTPADNYYLKIDILTNNVKDLAGNQSLSVPSQVGVLASY